MDLFDVISKKVTTQLIESNIIDESDYDIYRFGIYQNLGFLLNIITSIIIFCIFKMILEGIIFSITYFSLRSYAGGYHSKSSLACYFISTGLVMGSMYIISNLNIDIGIILLSFIAYIFIWWVAPVDTITKRLDFKEKQVYQNKTRKILLLIMCFVIIFKLMSFKRGIVTLLLAVLVESVMLIIGILDNLFRK